MKFQPVPAVLLVAACTVTNRRVDRGTEPVLYAPRLLTRIMDQNDYYPDPSRRKTETGEVILHFRIGADGIAQEPFLVDEARSTSSPRLITAAQQLFAHSRYEIGERYKDKVTSSVLFEIMPCGELQQASGLDYYYHLCIPPMQHPILSTP